MLEQEPLGKPVMAGSISISIVSVFCTLGARYSGLEAMSTRLCIWSDSKVEFVLLFATSWAKR